MRTPFRRTRPSWRVPETRPARPELWLFGVALVGMLLVEVAQSSRMAELGYDHDRIHSALDKQEARLEFERAQVDRRTTRAEITPLADQLGLAPADRRQIVVLPSAYLADPEGGAGEGRTPSLLALAERASRLVVPEATARGRVGN